MKESNLRLLEVGIFEGDQASSLKEQYPDYFVFYDKVTSVMKIDKYLTHGVNTSAEQVKQDYCNMLARKDHFSDENDPSTLRFHKHFYQDRLRMYRDESYLALLGRMKDRYARYVKAYELLNENQPEQFKKELEELSKYV